MTSLLQQEWRGVLALVWFVCGLLVLLLLERLIDPLFSEYFCVMWTIGGWLIPSVVMAFSGIRNGHVASRICAGLVLLALAAPIIFILYASHQLYGK
jgi:hypothetical protein